MKKNLINIQNTEQAYVAQVCESLRLLIRRGGCPMRTAFKEEIVFVIEPFIPDCCWHLRLLLRTCLFLRPVLRSLARLGSVLSTTTWDIFNLHCLILAVIKPLAGTQNISRGCPGSGFLKLTSMTLSGGESVTPAAFPASSAAVHMDVV